VNKAAVFEIGRQPEKKKVSARADDAVVGVVAGVGANVAVKDSAIATAINIVSGVSTITDSTMIQFGRPLRASRKQIMRSMKMLAMIDRSPANQLRNQRAKISNAPGMTSRIRVVAVAVGEVVRATATSSGREMIERNRTSRPRRKFPFLKWRPTTS
jgi:hypothetical protein